MPEHRAKKFNSGGFVRKNYKDDQPLIIQLCDPNSHYNQTLRAANKIISDAINEAKSALREASGGELYGDKLLDEYERFEDDTLR